MASVKLRLNRTKKSNDGKFPLVFQILHKRKKKVVSTKLRVCATEFDILAERILPHGVSKFTEKEVASMHRKLSKTRKLLLSEIKAFDKEWGDYTVHDVAASIGGGVRYQLLRCFDEQIASCKNENRIGMAEAYKSTKSSIFKFLKGKDIELSELNRRFVLEYESALMRQGVTRNTVAYYLRNLKTVYNRFVSIEYRNSEKYPFVNIRTSPIKTQKRSLSKNELVQLVKKKFNENEKHLDFARDIFLFSFYTRGMSFVDILHLKKSDIKNNYIIYERKKSKQRLQIALTEPLQSLIEKYSHSDEYVLPVLNSVPGNLLYKHYKKALARINRSLKIIGETLSLSITLTTYVARHSWAMQAKLLGTPMSVISEGLGHASETTTRIYLKALDSSIIDKVNESVVKLE